MPLSSSEMPMLTCSDYIDAMPPSDASDLEFGFVKYVDDQTKKLNEALKATLEKIRRSQKQLEAGEPISLDMVHFSYSFMEIQVCLNLDLNAARTFFKLVHLSERCGLRILSGTLDHTSFSSQ